MKLFRTLSLLFLLIYQSLGFADINSYFNSIKADPNALYTFLKRMPKGGELHYHLAGGAYPETMLAIAAQHNYCFDTMNWSVVKNSEGCKGIPSAELNHHPEAYNQVLKAWSMKDFVPGNESAHDHFFASFYKFFPIVSYHDAGLLSEIMHRAINQHEQYLEIMIIPDNANAIHFAPHHFSLDKMEQFKQQLLANPEFQANIQQTIKHSHELIQTVRHQAVCEAKPEQPLCKMTVKFQYYVLREQSLNKVFAQALNGFVAASQSPDLVGVNLVQAEDGIISLRDYHKQMQIFAFLHQAYPQVHIALHAGELAPQATTPENTRFHIHDAITTGHAERIGHGVDIAQEDGTFNLLQSMKEKGIVVEINLISNKEVLNVAGKQHPLRFYLNHQVPVVLSTDDEGILRTDLTAQYVEAVLHHSVDYPSLKQINRNALTYSFLPGKSLWQQRDKAIPVADCRDLNSETCLQFVKANQKARVQRQLELKLASFEQSIPRL